MFPLYDINCDTPKHVHIYQPIYFQIMFWHWSLKCPIKVTFWNSFRRHRFSDWVGWLTWWTLNTLWICHPQTSLCKWMSSERRLCCTEHWESVSHSVLKPNPQRPLLVEDSSCKKTRLLSYLFYGDMSKGCQKHVSFYIEQRMNTPVCVHWNWATMAGMFYCQIVAWRDKLPDSAEGQSEDDRAPLCSFSACPPC